MTVFIIELVMLSLMGCYGAVTLRFLLNSYANNVIAGLTRNPIILATTEGTPGQARGDEWAFAYLCS